MAGSSQSSTLKTVQNKVCLITGGVSGLGLGVARHLYLHGALLLLLDLPSSEAKARDLINTEFSPVRAAFIKADVTDEEQVQTALAQGLAKFGRIDVVLNNAGINLAHHAIYDSSTGNSYPAERMKNIIDVNVIGVLNILRLTAPILARNHADSDGEKGVIINTGSISGMDAVTHQIPYVLSKAAVNSITTPLAYELAALGIRVCCIAPGAFGCEALRDIPADSLKGHCMTNFFPSRPGKPEEFGHLVRCMIENPMMNGATVRLDGATRIFWVAG